MNEFKSISDGKSASEESQGLAGKILSQFDCFKQYCSKELAAVLEAITKAEDLFKQQ